MENGYRQGVAEQTIRYAAILTDGGTVGWDQTATWAVEDDDGPGNMLLAHKTGMYGIVAEGRFIPPHRIHEITWRV